MAKTQTAARKSSERAPRKPASPKSPAKKAAPRKWSAKVTETSDAMDLEKDIFKSDSPQRIATSVKRSAERSHRRKSGAFRSAMSMLTFYINRAGKNLSTSRRRVLDAAKNRLRRLFHRPAAG